MAFAAVTLTFPNFAWLFPALAHHLPFQQSFLASLVLFLGMIALIRRFPEEGKGKDLSPWVSRCLLLICLAVGAFLRLYHASQPAGSYSIDCASDISFARVVTDLANFQGTFSAVNDLLPLWLGISYSLWHLLPDASSLLIQRLSNTILDLAAIGFFYLAGKEIAGRRMGVIAAALAAVSKPLLALLVTGWCMSSFTLGMAMALFFTFRLMNQTNPLNFLYWGAFVGFLAYTVAYFQPFIPFFILVTFAWLFYRKGKEKRWSGPGWLAMATLLLLLIHFLYYLNAFSDHSLVSRLVVSRGGWKPFLAIAAVFSGSAFFSGRSFKNNLWFGWVVGAWLSALLSFPFSANEALINRIKQHALVGGGGFLSGPYLWATLQRVGDSFQKLFWAGSDRSDMAIGVDAFFGYPEVILIALGAAFVVARPTLPKLLLALTAAVGLALHAAATETHSLRLLGCPVPLLLIGAMGLNELCKLSLRAYKGKAVRVFTVLALVGFWAWSAWAVFSRVYVQWAEKPMGHVAILNAALQDVDRGNPVFLTPSLSDGQLTVLYEGHPVRLWRNSNLISVGSDEKGKDVVVYSQGDESFKKEMTRAFPGAVWSDVQNSDLDPARTVVACRCQIPFDSLLKSEQNLLRVQKVDAPYWKRSFSSYDSGLVFGFLVWEDKSTTGRDPVPPEGIVNDEAVRYEAQIHVAQGGSFEFSCKTERRTKVRVDGKTLIDLVFLRTADYLEPEKAGKKTMFLGPGDHKVEVTTIYQSNWLPPDILVAPGGGSGKRSLWSSFAL